MRSARSMLATAFGLAALTVTGLGTTSASATIPHSDSPKYVTVEGHKVVAGTTIGEWGRTVQGNAFSFTYQAGKAKPAGAVPAALAAAICSVYISDVELRGAGANAWFSWETSQACSGSFGTQKLQTQMWRSSWSGPRGYNDWVTSGSTTSSFIDYGWSSDCNDGGGTYTYYPVMKGYASGIGWGPTTRSDNELRRGCGTRQP